VVILHIARVSDDPYNGVCNVVPMHVISQQAHIEVALLNITPNRIENIKTQFTCEKKISDLSEPFNKPDLVVFHEIYFLPYLSYSRELRKRKIPYIIIPHGGLTEDAQKIKKLKKQIANPLLFNRFIYGAKAVQCLSQFEMDDTKKHNTKFVETNGIAVPETKKGSFNNEKIEFVYIGRIAVYHKGLDILLEAVSHIKEYLEEKKCVFSIYGPSDEEQYEKMNSMLDQYRLRNVVQLHPAVSGKEKEKALLTTKRICRKIYLS
jgi:glycosyltransferase involved in cell wall biosynthesis